MDTILQQSQPCHQGKRQYMTVITKVW